MRKLLILLLGAILIGILSYFCFLDKAEVIKDDLVSKTQSAYASKQMDWVKSGIKGQDLGMTRVVTLEGIAPSAEMKEEAARIALAQEGVDGVDNRLVIAKVAGGVDAKSVDVEVVSSKPDPTPITDVEMVEKPDPIPIVGVAAPVKLPPKAPVKAVFSCQDSFKKILSSGKINFTSGKSVIQPESYKLLDSLVAVAKKCPNDAVAIGGHSDSVGSKKFNKTLSASRANAVKEYLINKGISGNRLQAIGYGESKPIADNSTDEGRAKNRRIEFNVIDIKEVPTIAEPIDSEFVEIKSISQVKKSSKSVNFDDIPFAKTIKLDASDRNLGAVQLGSTVLNVPETMSKKGHVLVSKAAICQNKFKEILQSEKIKFAYNKADIKSSSHNLLNSLVEVAKECPNELVVISGYTDSDGSESYNKRLSTNRASAVRAYLINKGIPSKRLKAIGYGESNPIADNNTIEGKAKNRRIEFNVKGVK